MALKKKSILLSMAFLNGELKLNLPVHWINCVEGWRITCLWYLYPWFSAALFVDFSFFTKKLYFLRETVSLKCFIYVSA